MLVLNGSDRPTKPLDPGPDAILSGQLNHHHSQRARRGRRSRSGWWQPCDGDHSYIQFIYHSYTSNPRQHPYLPIPYYFTYRIIYGSRLPLSPLSLCPPLRPYTCRPPDRILPALPAREYG